MFEFMGWNIFCVVDVNDNICEKVFNCNIEVDMIKEVSCGSFFGLELIEELEFKDVDVFLYDFDVFNGFFLIDFDEFCSVWNFGLISVVVRSLFVRCSDSLKFGWVNEFVIDELD